MRFREFFIVSEAKFNQRQIQQHGLGAGTTLRRNIDGWDLWFRDNVSELPQSTHQLRQILFSLNDRNLNEEIIQEIKEKVKRSLSIRNRRSLAKFQQASAFRSTGLPLDALYTKNKYNASLFEKFSSVVKGINLDNLDIEEKTMHYTKLLFPIFLYSSFKDFEMSYRQRLLNLLRDITDVDMPYKLVEGEKVDNLYAILQKIAGKDASRTVVEDEIIERIKNEFIHSVKWIIGSFQQYHVQFEQQEVEFFMDNMINAIHDVILIVAEKVTGDKDINPAMNDRGGPKYNQLLNAINTTILPKIEELMKPDVDDFFKFIGNVRQSRRKIETDETLDGLVYYLTYRAVSIIKSVMHNAVRAGTTVNEGHFQEWMKQCIDNFTKVLRVLMSLGIRKTARVPIIFNYQDWSQFDPYFNTNIAGAYYLGDRRKQSTKAASGVGFQRDRSKHNNYIQLYQSNINVIAHEIGHTVYATLPAEQQKAVEYVANESLPPSAYGAPDYLYPGHKQPVKAHRSGNEWFAEMLALLATRPELLNTPIEVHPSGTEFAPRGGEPLKQMPTKPAGTKMTNPLRSRQVQNLNTMVKEFKKIFAVQGNDYLDYKQDKMKGQFRLPRRFGNRLKKSDFPKTFPPMPTPPSTQP